MKVITPNPARPITPRVNRNQGNHVLVNQAKAQNEAPVADTADATVSKFSMRWMERGSNQYAAAYRADLTALARWLAERGTPIIKTTRADLSVHRTASKRVPDRVPPRQLSSFRRFFRYLFVKE